jgi:hypothetical protein
LGSSGTAAIAWNMEFNERFPGCIAKEMNVANPRKQMETEMIVLTVKPVRNRTCNCVIPNKKLF